MRAQSGMGPSCSTSRFLFHLTSVHLCNHDLAIRPCPTLGFSPFRLLLPSSFAQSQSPLLPQLLHQTTDLFPTSAQSDTWLVSLPSSFHTILGDGHCPSALNATPIICHTLMPEHNEHLLKWLDLQDLTYTHEHWAGFLIDFLNDFLIGKKGQGKRLVHGNAGCSASIRSRPQILGSPGPFACSDSAENSRLQAVKSILEESAEHPSQSDTSSCTPIPLSPRTASG